MTTKFRRSHDLQAFKVDFAAGKVEATVVADQGMAALGMTKADRAVVIASMTAEHFKKSATSHDNSHQWQDYYSVPAGDVVVFVKFTGRIVTEFKLLSFKEDAPW